MIHLSHHDNLTKVNAREGDTIVVSLAFSPRKGHRWKESPVVSLRELSHEPSALVEFTFVVLKAGVVTLYHQDGSKWFEVELAI